MVLGRSPLENIRVPPPGFSFRRHLDLYFHSSQLHPYFPPPIPLTSHGMFKLERGSCAPLARPQQFLSSPGYVARLVVLTSRTPLPALRWFPYVEETGGKIFRSNGKHPGDVRIARIADPLASEVLKRKEGGPGFAPSTFFI